MPLNCFLLNLLSFVPQASSLTVISWTFENLFSGGLCLSAWVKKSSNID